MPGGIRSNTYIKTIRIQIGKKHWDLETCWKVSKKSVVYNWATALLKVEFGCFSQL